MTVHQFPHWLLGTLALVIGVLTVPSASVTASTLNFDTESGTGASYGAAIATQYHQIARVTVAGTVAGAPVLEGTSVPIANAGPNREAEAGDLIVLDGKKSYAPIAPRKPLTYFWSQVSGPATVKLAGATTVSPSFTPTVPGVYVFSLVVRDDVNSSLPSTVQVNILPEERGCLGQC